MKRFDPAPFSRSGPIVALLFLACVGLSGRIEAAPAIRTDFPCKGCLFLPPPDGATNVPLLVVLHGDAPGGKKPLVQRDSEPFFKAVAERGFAAFAPMCPKEEGCLVGSYWQWTQNDPPAWIAKQVASIRKDTSIDADRIWIAGWSGGASFLGYQYGRLHELYGAVVFAGGGIAPASSTCDPCAPPAYFLVGDKNPLHHLAKDLKTSILTCTNDVTWDLLPGKEHGGEWRALNAAGKVGEMLDWLAKRPRSCPGMAKTAAPSPTTSAVSAPPLPPAPVPQAPTPVASSPPAGAHARGCAIVEPVESGGIGVFFWGVVVIGVLRRRMRS